MPTPSPAADPKRLPTVPPDRPVPSLAGKNAEFSFLEWNALTKRAMAVLQALEACRQAGEEDTSCPHSPVGSGGRQPDQRDPEPAWRARFRATQHQLSRLVHRVTGPERHQLQRTVASLHLAYRHLDRSEEGR